jgi:hypothetical protein
MAQQLKEYEVRINAELYVSTSHFVEAKSKNDARQIVEAKLAKTAGSNGVPDDVSDDLWDSFQSGSQLEFRSPSIGYVEVA